jgi:hypothetical protein
MGMIMRTASIKSTAIKPKSLDIATKPNEKENLQTAAMWLLYTKEIYHNNVCTFLKVCYHTVFQNPKLGGAGIVPTS